MGEKKPIGEEKIVTVAGLLLIRGLRIQSQPRCYKWTRRPEPICCLSSSNGDQFQVEKNQVEPERENASGDLLPGTSCLQQQEEEEKERKRLKRRLCGLGWDLRIDRAIFVRPSLTEPPEILNLLLLPFSPFSSTFSSSSSSSSSSGRGKNGGECVVLSTPAPPATSTQ